MKKNYLYFIATFLFCYCHSYLVFSQTNGLENLGFHFKNPNTKKIKVNFELYNNLIVVPVRVNELDTLNFALDTGVGYTLITDPQVMKTLRLKSLRKIKVAGSGTNTELMGSIVNIQNIALRNIIAYNHNLIVLDQDVLHLSQYAGVKIHGLLGYDLFSRFVVKINYSNKTLTFYKPEHYQYENKHGEIFPIIIEQLKPYVQAEATLTSSSATPVKLILDTGAGHSLSLDAGTHPNIKVPEKNIPSQLGMTLNGAVEGAIGRIEKFKIGSFEMQKVITSFPDTASLKHVKGFSQRQGNLGCGVLKRFHVTFDYMRERLILKPNRSYKEPFEFNTSGLDLTAFGPDFKKYKIGSIRPNSPAELAGLEKDDEVLSIDNEMVSKMSLGQAYKLINKKEGRKTLLLVKRYAEWIFVELTLKQPI